MSMSMVKLRLSMIGTLALIIGISTLFFTFLLVIIGVTDIISIGLFIVVFNVAQWLFAPYLIDSMYRAKKVSQSDEPELYNMVEQLSQKSGIKTPTLMIAKIPIPNAFAYGSLIAGTRVAVTSELLNTLDSEEVEAVIGHELGHLRHRDVQTMMVVSLLPALFYYIGFSLFWSAQFRGGRDDRGNAGLAVLIGLLGMLVYWILTLFTLYLSRLREYYADRHSVSIVHDGARKLSEGLVKIVDSTARVRMHRPDAHNLSSFKALFICDPDSAGKDIEELNQAGAYTTDRNLVEKYLRRRVTAAETMMEMFSTHPNIVKRLRALQELY